MNEYCVQLKEIRDSIPGYAEWTIDELLALFKRYREIMVHVVSLDEYRAGEHLREQSPDIEHYIMFALKKAKTKKEKTEQKDAFDHAVTDLMLDIDELLRLIGCDEAA